MRSEFFVAVLLASLLFVNGDASIHAQAASGPSSGVTPKLTGIFSTMHYNRSSGDVSGVEVFIMFTNDGYRASVQVAEGVPAVPMLVTVKITGTRLMFDVPYDGLVLRFEGNIRQDGITGRFGQVDSQEPITLKRGQSYWQ